MATQSRNGLTDIVWELFVSIKFTVFLLALWLVASVIGTLIPQNSPPAQYVELYGPELANWFMRLGFFDVYHATWYALILLLLLLAVTACSLNGFEAKRALAYIGPKSRRVSGSGKKYVNLDIPAKDPAHALESLKTALSRTYKQLEVFEEDGVRRLFAQKQPWAHFMVYLVHASVVLVILGGMISALFGFEGRMVIEEGSTTDVISRHENGISVRGQLPFQLRLNAFEYQRFADGSPKDWISNLTVIDEGEEVLTKSIEVNDPLFYESINFYQSSWIERLMFHVREAEGERQVRVLLGEREDTFVPQLNLAIALESKFQRGGMTMATLMIVGKDGQTRRLVVTSDEEENAHRQAGLPVRISLDPKGVHFATVLQVVADPGVGLVWVGCFVMMLGLYLTFYSSHRRISVAVQDKGLELRGLAQRNIPGFRREIEKALSDSGLTFTRSNSEGTP